MSWIQDTKLDETITNHVKCGYDPRTNLDVTTRGPIVMVYADRFSSINRYSPGTYIDDFTIKSDIIWHNDQDAPNAFIKEIDFISAIIDEFKAQRTQLDSTHGGEIWSIDVDDFIMENADKRNERVLTISASVRSGDSQ